jgi:hypothetical protein
MRMPFLAQQLGGLHVMQAVAVQHQNGFSEPRR